MSISSNASLAEIEEPLPAALNAVPSLRHNFAWTLVGSVLYAGCQWGMLSVLAKLGSPSIVGEFTLGLAVSAPVFMFANLQLRAVQATEVSRETEFASYFTLRLLATLLGLLVIVALLPFTADSSAVRLVILLVAVSKCIECLSDVTAGLLQREERLKLVSISLMLRGAGSVLVFSIVFAATRNLAWAVLAMSGVWFFVFILYDVRNTKAAIAPGQIFFRFNASELRRIMKLGLPLGLVATLVSLNANIPRYFLQHQLGLAEQGIYASLAYLVVGVNLIVLALSQSVTTRLARMFAAGERSRFLRILFKLSLLGVAIAVLGVMLSFVAGRQLLTLVYRPEYAEHVALLAILVAATGISTIGAFLFCGITAARTFRAQVPAYLMSLVVTIVGSWQLIPRWGLLGAGFTLVLSALTLLAGGAVILRHVLRPQIECCGE